MYKNSNLFYNNKLVKLLFSENNRKILNDGIWKLFENNKKTDIYLTSEKSYYKRFNNIVQAINLLKGNELLNIIYIIDIAYVL